MDIYCWKTSPCCRLDQCRRPTWSLKLSWSSRWREPFAPLSDPQLTIKSAGMLFPPAVEVIVTFRICGQFLSRFRSLSYHEAHALHERLCPASSELMSLPPPPVAFWMPRAAARAMTLLTTPPATLSKYVCTCWSTTALIGEHVVHGGNALGSNRVTCPPVGCAAAKYCFEGIEQ